jgi:hypothetical protein
MYTELKVNPRFLNSSSADRVFAPMTWGCPANYLSIDYAVFKKTLQEKMKVFTFKKQLGKTKNHKFVAHFKGSF